MATIAIFHAVWLAVVLAGADANLGWPGAISVSAREAAELPDAQRLRALERLTARAGERALPVLVPLLTDRDPGIRLFAARRLGRAGVPAAIALAGAVLHVKGSAADGSVNLLTVLAAVPGTVRETTAVH